MSEREPRSVEELPSQPRFGRAVHGVSDDREADRGQVHADLVRSTRLEVHAQERVCLFTVGGVTLLLLLIGIHNAWDAITYHVFTHMQEVDREQAPEREER